MVLFSATRDHVGSGLKPSVGVDSTTLGFLLCYSTRGLRTVGPLKSPKSNYLRVSYTGYFLQRLTLPAGERNVSPLGSQSLIIPSPNRHSVRPSVPSPSPLYSPLPIIILSLLPSTLPLPHSHSNSLFPFSSLRITSLAFFSVSSVVLKVVREKVEDRGCRN